MSRALYLPLPSDVREALFREAEREWRHPKDQAALLLIEALRARGLLLADPQHFAATSDAPYLAHSQSCADGNLPA
jgi:hypothetical protein